MLVGLRAGQGRMAAVRLGGGRASGQVSWTPNPHVQSCPRQRPEWPVWGHGEGRRLGSVSSEAPGHAGRPSTGAGGRGDKDSGSPHRVADLTLRLGRQPSGPPEPVWGFWKLQVPGSRPANQALSTGKCWEPPLPLAGVGQSSPVLVTRSREFYRKQSGQ